MKRKQTCTQEERCNKRLAHSRSAERTFASQDAGLETKKILIKLNCFGGDGPIDLILDYSLPEYYLLSFKMESRTFILMVPYTDQTDKVLESLESNDWIGLNEDGRRKYFVGPNKEKGEWFKRQLPKQFVSTKLYIRGNLDLFIEF